MYKASIENRGDTRCFATTRHSSFVLDTKGNGANPVDTLLASLCGCLAHYVGDFLREEEISHGGFSIHSQAGTTPDKASLDQVEVLIQLKEAKLTEQQSRSLLKFVENCKVHKILNARPGVAISLG